MSGQFKTCLDTRIKKTVRYLGVDFEDALLLSERTEI